MTVILVLAAAYLAASTAAAVAIARAIHLADLRPTNPPAVARGEDADRRGLHAAR